MILTQSEKQQSQMINFEMTRKFWDAIQNSEYDVIIDPPVDPIRISFNPRVLNSGNWGYEFLQIPSISDKIKKGETPKRKIIYVVVDTMAYPVHDALKGFFVDSKFCFDHTSDNNGVDGHGHGHHCAGIIMGKVLGKRLGVNHIPGYATQDLIMGQKGLSSNGGGASTWLSNAILKALDVCRDQFPDYTPIFSLSWGSGTSSSRINNAIDTVIRNGGFVVSSAGNNGTNTIGWPAAHTNVIANGSVDSNGKRSSFSQYGDGLHSVAPGRNIWSTYKTNGQYVSWSGTSMSCPHQAAMIGHVLKFNPQIKSQKDYLEFIKEVMTDAGPSGYDVEYGWGYPLAERLLSKSAPEDPDQPNDPEPPKPEPPKDDPKPPTRGKRKVNIIIEGDWKISWRSERNFEEAFNFQVDSEDLEFLKLSNELTVTKIVAEKESSLFAEDLYDWMEVAVTKVLTRRSLGLPANRDFQDAAYWTGRFLEVLLKGQSFDCDILELHAVDHEGRKVVKKIK